MMKSIVVNYPTCRMSQKFAAALYCARLPAALRCRSYLSAARSRRATLAEPCEHRESFDSQLMDCCAQGERSGARGRDRTADTAIFSRMLYQLSYPGIGPCRTACRVGFQGSSPDRRFGAPP